MSYLNENAIHRCIQNVGTVFEKLFKTKMKFISSRKGSEIFF